MKSCFRNGKWGGVGGRGAKVLGADCPQGQVGAAGVSRLVLVFRKRAGRGAGSGQLNYLGYRGAIYLPGLTCFCCLGELCNMENR